MIGVPPRSGTHRACWRNIDVRRYWLRRPNGQAFLADLRGWMKYNLDGLTTFGRYIPSTAS